MNNSEGSNDLSPPFFSVVINFYNGDAFLEEAVKSILSQTFKNWELILWDNQSTDGSSVVASAFSDSRVRYFYAPSHTKLGQARNLAANEAKGEWLGFLDCDDIWLPDKLERQFNIITESGSDLGLVYGQMLVLNEHPTSCSIWSKQMQRYSKKTLLKRLPEGMIFSKLLLIDFIPLVSAMVRTSLYREIGGVANHFEMSEDYDLFLKVARSHKIRAVQDVVALYRIHQTNTSISKQEKGLEETLEILNRFCPEPDAIRGLKFHNSCYAFRQIRDGKYLKGLRYFFLHGGLFSCFIMLRLKLFRSLA